VYFPKADDAETVVAAPLSMPQPIAGGQTVLVVDDELGLLDLARKLLQRQGYKVLVAANADDATRVFEQNAAIDVILADVVMPGTSGPELTSRLVGRRPALKVIFMSGHTEETMGHHGVFTSGTAFLQKPFTSETLGRKIHEVLKR
jgi:DNA-binding NtrC family response regulator